MINIQKKRERNFQRIINRMRKVNKKEKEKEEEERKKRVTDVCYFSMMKNPLEFEKKRKEANIVLLEIKKKYKNEWNTVDRC